jgi:hypothetical protein
MAYTSEVTLNVGAMPDKPRGFDVTALAGAREYCPNFGTFPRREPGIRYYDLDGFEQYCPSKVNISEQFVTT